MLLGFLVRRLGQGGRRGERRPPSAAGRGEEGRDLPWCWFQCVLIVRPNSRTPVALVKAGQAERSFARGPPCGGLAVLLPAMAVRCVPRAR